MALSHLLWRYVREKPLSGISLVLTHVHHGVRKESDDEEQMVQAMAAKWEITCLVHRFDAKGYAELMGQSFEEAAREWRYARWKEDMSKEGCTLLATGHHLGDQAETILYRLFRGSGTAGLAGIYPIRDSIIRPLLTVSKADILNYCEREGLPYALDRSNEELIYTRNRIRLELLPELQKEYNPRIQEALGRTGELLRWDEEYLTQQVDVAWKHYHILDSVGTLGLRPDVFTETAAILSRLLRRAAKLVTGEPRGLGFNYVTKIMGSEGKPGWAQDLPGLTVHITEEGIWFIGYATTTKTPSAVKTPHSQETLQRAFPETILELGRWCVIPGLRMDIGLLEEGNLSTVNLSDGVANKLAVFSRELLDQSPNQLVCRTRQQGDKMWFTGVGHKSLKKLFQEDNISIKIRNELPLIAYGSEVLWIPGVRQSGLFQPDQKSKRVYCILKPHV